MTPATKRAIFPLSAPRWQTYAFWPCHVWTAAVHGYYEAFFAVLPRE